MAPFADQAILGLTTSSDRFYPLIPGNNVIACTYTQLGADGGLHFVGTIKGLLPIGPNGIPAFNTLDERSTASFPATALHPTYNYTLELQGISTDVSCTYEAESPVAEFVPTTNGWQFNGTCPPGRDIFPNTTNFLTAPRSNNYLGFWACFTEPSSDSYNIYFRGFKNYESEIGNITCSVGPIQPTVFPLTYIGQPDIFTAQIPSASSPSSPTELGSRMVMSIGSIVWEAQTVMSNLFAESIITSGVKSFRLQPYTPTTEYAPAALRIAMVSGYI